MSQQKHERPKAPLPPERIDYLLDKIVRGRTGASEGLRADFEHMAEMAKSATALEQQVGQHETQISGNVEELKEQIAEHVRVSLDLAKRNNELRQALRFYGHRDHILFGAPELSEKYESVSGEPDNWHFFVREESDPVAAIDGYEDGQIARQALRGQPVSWDGQPPEPVEGELEEGTTPPAPVESLRGG